MYQRRHRRRDLVGYNRDEAVAPGADNWHGQPVVTRQHGKAGRSLTKNLHYLLEVAARLLDPHHV
jgi:hypothetical protein